MRKIAVYLLIAFLIISQSPVESMAISHDEKDTDEKVILLAEHIGDEIEGYGSIDSINRNKAEYLLPDETEAILVESEEETEVNGIIYTLVQYLDPEDTDALIELYVEDTVIVPLEQVDEYKENRIENPESDDTLSNEDSLEENEESENSEENQENPSIVEEFPPTNDPKEIEEDGKEDVASKTDAPVEAPTVAETNELDKSSIEMFSSRARVGIVESKTSKLGHIRNTKVRIYETIGGQSIAAGSQYTNAVYYIKKQASQGQDLYYLISTSPSSVKGIVGWVKAKDLSTRTHTGVDKRSKNFSLNGKGKTTTKAWGGSKDTVHASLSKLKNDTFHVNLTEKVGNNTWYRGKINGKGENVWVHSSYVTTVSESKVSKLGHIRHQNVVIHETIGGKTFSAGSKYTNAVYYIKNQAKQGSETYYLISTSPSATKGTIGWINKKDLSTHNHVGVDKKSKVFYLKGTGKATSKAWGGKKDEVYSSLSDFKHQRFVVNLTEKVGNNTWYRGKIDGVGENVWVHSSFVNTDISESSVSMLGHIRSSNVRIYDRIGGNYVISGSQYTNAVYYIKRQAELGNDIFYLISTSPSATKGTVGWVHEKDLSTHIHVGVDKKTKVFYLNGKGKTTTKAWGGPKDTVHSSLANLKGELFQVNLTEKVGNNTWYRGKLNGQGTNLWVHSSFVTQTLTKNTVYNLSLTDALNMQYARLHNATSKNNMLYYLDPANFINDTKQKFQFLILSQPSGMTIAQLDKALNMKGTLHKQGTAFYNAARIHSVNEIYLMSHAILETGHGKSTLASGVEVGLDKKGNHQLVTTKNRNNLTDIKTTYNMFGIGAIDTDPIGQGAITAYKNKWYTPSAAINGGAKWISEGYFNNQHKQNTLYKMRWNPNMDKGFAWKQYATDIGWAYKQANIIYGIYSDLGFPTSMAFDYVTYK